MRTVKAVLPEKMPAVFAGLGLRDHSYQDLSSNEVHTPSGIAVEASSHPSSQKFRGFIITFIVGAVILSSLLLLTTTRGPTMKSVNDSAWMEGSKLGTAYCKTSCTSQCSSYFSVYGPLCCDWAEGAGGTKFCAQSISKEGKCECGVSTSSSKSDQSDKQKSPGSHPAPAPHDDGMMHPFPTMAWMPFDDDNGGDDGDNGWLPFKPFKPIKKPENSTPCKSHCDNPCATSNGMCCEATASGNCEQTNIDGKCYCGTD